jgi:hypothetical protein
LFQNGYSEPQIYSIIDAKPLQLSGIQAKPRRLVWDRPFEESVLASLEEVTVGNQMV